MLGFGPNDPAHSLPQCLRSAKDGLPFASCIDCQRVLLGSGMPYALEKVVRDGEVIFEYAICAECTKRLFEQFSEESIEKINEYLRAGPEAWQRRLLESLFVAQTEPHLRNQEILRLGEPLHHCHRCGKTGEGFQAEHTVAGLLAGPRLAAAPLTLCSACTEGADQRLSRHTRDTHEDFVRTRFPGVPAGLDLPTGLIAI